jgi:hypothetical protein
MSDPKGPAAGIPIVQLLADDVVLDDDDFRIAWGSAFLLVEGALQEIPFDVDGTLPQNEGLAARALQQGSTTTDALVFALRRRTAAVGRPLTLGRTEATDVVVADRSVSKLHLFLEHTPEGRLRVQDAGSKNGTWIRGARLPPPPDNTAAHLDPGDSVTVGTVRVRYLDLKNLRAWLGAHPQRPVPGGRARVEKPVGDESGQHVFAAAVAALDAVAKFREGGVELSIPGGAKTLTDLEIPDLAAPPTEHE